MVILEFGNGVIQDKNNMRNLKGYGKRGSDGTNVLANIQKCK